MDKGTDRLRKSKHGIPQEIKDSHITIKGFKTSPVQKRFTGRYYIILPHYLHIDNICNSPTTPRDAIGSAVRSADC